jgi:hypothetical protein
MSALATSQAVFAQWLLHQDSGKCPRVQGINADARLRIYADAYRLRLIEVLGNDFPKTRAAYGDEAFVAVAERYLHAYPSKHPSVRHFGRHFASWLARQPHTSHATQELAHAEWAQIECFDAVDAPVLGIDTVAAMAPEAWPALLLQLHPAVRLLPGKVLWRDSDGGVRWRELEADEAEALHAIASEGCFGEICELLAVHHGAAGSLRAASLLKRWLTDGLLHARPMPTSI